MWDTIGACDIRGASDASIRNVEPNDVAALIRKLGVQAVFCNGAASGRVYAKYAQRQARVCPPWCCQHQPRQRGVVDGASAHRLGPGTAAFLQENGFERTNFVL